MPDALFSAYVEMNVLELCRMICWNKEKFKMVATRSFRNLDQAFLGEVYLLVFNTP